MLNKPTTPSYKGQLQALGFSIGDELEVLWQIVKDSEDGAESYQKVWWKARLAAAKRFKDVASTDQIKQKTSLGNCLQTKNECDEAKLIEASINSFSPKSDLKRQRDCTGVSEGMYPSNTIEPKTKVPRCDQQKDKVSCPPAAPGDTLAPQCVTNQPALNPSGSQQHNIQGNSATCKHEDPQKNEGTDQAGNPITEQAPASTDQRKQNGYISSSDGYAIDEDGGYVFTLQYDAYEGFDEETLDVVFVEHGWLRDMQSQTDMRWKRPGDVDPETDEEAAMAEIVDVKEVANEIEMETREQLGKAPEAVMMEQISHLPYNMQQRVAEKYGEFVRGFGAAFKRVMSGHTRNDEGEVIVTKSMVDEALSNMGQQTSKTQ